MEIRAPDVRQVRIFHSLTGVTLLVVEHPRLGQVRGFQLKSWAWNRLRGSLPDGYTLFNVEVLHGRRPIHSFQALMSLTEEEVLEVGNVIKELQTPSPRVRRCMTEAISRHQADLIWNYLCKYQVPELVRVLRGETMNPLSLLLWAPYRVVEDTRQCPRALEALLAARCSPNQLGSPARAPLSIAVERDDRESVEELLSYRADPNIASAGEDPPLCVAVRTCRRDIVAALLRFRADLNLRSIAISPYDDDSGGAGCTPIELARGDQLLEMLLVQSDCPREDCSGDLGSTV